MNNSNVINNNSESTGAGEQEACEIKEFKIFGDGFDSPLASPLSPPEFQSAAFGHIRSLEEAAKDLQLNQSPLPATLSPRSAPAGFFSKPRFNTFQFPPPNFYGSSTCALTRYGSVRSMAPPSPHSSHLYSFSTLRHSYKEDSQIRNIRLLAPLPAVSSGVIAQRRRLDQQNVVCIPSQVCGYCKALNKPFTGHKKENCPELARLEPCKICHASGPNNHTVSHCPKKSKILLRLKSVESRSKD